MTPIAVCIKDYNLSNRKALDDLLQIYSLIGNEKRVKKDGLELDNSAINILRNIVSVDIREGEGQRKKIK